ncbi:oligomeric Golgi complex subunit 6 [Ceratocystis lukuohia]|uniref:Conserved oligomeric Golgi complex subunit 6 n=1 Tax=Ceratocystis lukuohia TaxID=2019550 RepID=A0ABR4MLB7_9PEZI
MDTQPKLSVISGNFRAAGDDSLSPAPSSASSLRGATNPLTSKVTSVLSTSFADSEFRDALALLDARGIKNTPDTRRELRLDLQMEIIDSNAVIVDDFGRVAEQLRRIGTTLKRLNKNYSDIKQEVQGAHSQTAQLMDESKVLIEKRQNIETKRELLNKIRDHFILTQDEIDLLSLSSEPVNDLFFAALAKAKVIQKDSEALLGFENQKLGLELMEQVSKHVNMAFQKLYKWLQREFKALNLENPQLHPAIRKAIRVLAERPTLFQNCLDFFADARERILSDSFYTALTGINAAGHQESVSKPIELVAHDSLRYVGDMLAWTHSATVGEKEALEVLFVSEGDEIAKGLESGRKNEIWSLVHDETSNEEPFDARKALNELVDRDIAGASRLLRQRIQQVIQNNEDTILAYKLANLLGFYKAMFSKVLGPNSALIQLIVNLEQEALRQFMTLVRDHIATLQTEFQKTPDDLGPPVFLQEALDQLGVIMETYDSSIDAASDKEKEFEAILTEALNPFVSGCREMAESLPSPGKFIFRLNCNLTVLAALGPFSFTEKKRSETQRDVDSDAATLLESQLSLLKKNSGLQEIFLAVRGLDATDKEAVKSLHRLKPFEPTSLKLARQTLDDFLPSALIDAMEHIKLIRDSKISRQITEDAAEKFCQEFEHLEDVLLADEALFAAEAYDGDIDPFKDLFPRTTGEIRVLLS